MPFESRRLRLQMHCFEDTMIRLCPNHSKPLCFKVGSPCLFNSCGPHSPVVVCPGVATDDCFPSPVIDDPRTPWRIPQDPIPIEPDPEDPDVVLLRPEHLPRLRGRLQLELAQIDEIAHRKGEIEGQLEELESAEKELKKRAG
jgi:hypothetical protein